MKGWALGRQGIDPDRFKDMMSSVAATVTVVTWYAGDEPLGITVSAFSSVSVVPPIVLVCIDKVSTSLEAILAADGFTVNFLDDASSDVAVTFATKGADRFSAVGWSPPSIDGAGPVLDVAYGVFECVTIERLEMGDHWVIFGRVDAGGRTDEVCSPLIYLARQYVRTEPI
ncbi:MAG: flavin reductase family protein [Acidimicrobiia bacterium]|nr:MAG: flavin reductase family protein [Acidimicrobiia bacterium]